MFNFTSADYALAAVTETAAELRQMLTYIFIILTLTIYSKRQLK